MATDLKTIKFGEDGETYCVNQPLVQVSGTLTEDATELDFGTFDGLTELNVAIQGVSGTSGNYVYIKVNGVTSQFVNCAYPYSGQYVLRIKKVGEVWTVDSGGDASWYAKYSAAFEGVETITSFSIPAYAGTPFVTGTKYALEGR